MIKMPSSPEKPVYIVDHNRPFGGIFGKTVIASVLEQFIVDSDVLYTVKDLAELTEHSQKAVRNALNQLVATNLILKIKDKTMDKTGNGYLYGLNQEASRSIALSLLIFAIGDDRYSTSVMLYAIREVAKDIVLEGDN
ncbi:MAG: hypothetical protein QXP38_06750 [Nitrososphaerota archaeon]